MAAVHPSRLLAALAALTALLVPAAAVAQERLPGSNGRPASVSSGAVLLLDSFGRPLYAKNADDERAPASLVKLMTLYLANEDIERGKAELDEPVQISHYAALTPKYRMGLRAGEWVPLHVLREGAAVAAWRGGQQFVMILLGARTRTSSFRDAKMLLHYAFVEAGLEPPDERSRRGPRMPGRPRRAAATR